jgi:hypothetical protein
VVVWDEPTTQNPKERLMKKTTKWLSKLAVPAAALAAAVALNVPAGLAKEPSLRIYKAGAVAGTLLTPGDYRLEVAPSLRTVTFRRGKEVILTVPCRVGFLTEPILGDSIYYTAGGDGGETISRILLLDSKLTIDLTEPAEGPEVAKLGSGAK